MRVWLKTWGGKESLTFRSEGGFVAMDADGNRLAEVAAELTLKATAGKVAGGELSAAVLVLAPKSNAITLSAGSDKGAFRGWLRVSADGNRLRVVNEVALETYLLGVVPAEMPSGFPAEALKAQSVAARTFTLRRMTHAKDADYDLTDGEGSQTYRGQSAEKPATTEAVQATSGQILFGEDDFCDAVYCADCGGYSAAAEEMGFGAKTPYLSGTDDEGPEGDYCAQAKQHEWFVDVTGEKMAAILRKLKKEVGGVVGVAVSAVGPSGRAQRVAIEGQTGSAEVSGASLRAALGYDVLRSTMFTVEDIEGGWRFVGKGWGHGVGLCQHGAAGRARAGQSYSEILAAYYPGANLQTVPMDARVTSSLLSRKASRHKGRP